MKPFFLKILTYFFNFIFKYRKIKPNKNISVKVNLGCGLTALPDYYNLDGSLHTIFGGKITLINRLLYNISGVSKFHDFHFFNTFLKSTKLYYCNFYQGILPFADSSVDILYTSHTLEHLNGKNGKQVISEIYRILKDGGVCRISLPCLDKAMEFYKKGNFNRLLRFFYADNDESFHSHRYAYNKEILSVILKKAGFKEVKNSSYQSDDFPDSKFLDNRESESFFINAIK